MPAPLLRLHPVGADRTAPGYAIAEAITPDGTPTGDALLVEGADVTVMVWHLAGPLTCTCGGTDGTTACACATADAHHAAAHRYLDERGPLTGPDPGYFAPDP